MTNTERLVAYTLVPGKIVRPFGRRLGERYACPACERRFVLEDHKQRHCSARCKKIEQNRRRSDLRCARLAPSASVVKNGSSVAHFTGLSGAEKVHPPPEYGSPGWEARCDRELALAQEMSMIEASLPKPADEADDGQPDDRTRRRRLERLIQDAVDKALAADRAGTLRTQVAARQALLAAIAARRGDATGNPVEKSDG